MRNMNAADVWDVIKFRQPKEKTVPVHDEVGRYEVWEKIEDDRGFKDWPDRSTRTHELLAPVEKIHLVEAYNAGGRLERVVIDAGHGCYRILWLEDGLRSPQLKVGELFFTSYKGNDLNRVKVLESL